MCFSILNMCFLIFRNSYGMVLPDLTRSLITKAGGDPSGAHLLPPSPFFKPRIKHGSGMAGTRRAVPVDLNGSRKNGLDTAPRRASAVREVLKLMGRRQVAVSKGGNTKRGKEKVEESRDVKAPQPNIVAQKVARKPTPTLLARKGSQIDPDKRKRELLVSMRIRGGAKNLTHLGPLMRTVSERVSETLIRISKIPQVRVSLTFENRVSSIWSQPRPWKNPLKL